MAGPRALAEQQGGPLNPPTDRLTLDLMEGTFAVCLLDAADPLPAWWDRGPFACVTRTADELSVVCPAEAVPLGVRSEPGWRVLRLAGPIPFTAVGVLASLSVPLAMAGVGIFALSTFETDYILVREPDLDRASTALRGAGHTVNAAAGRGGRPRADRAGRTDPPSPSGPVR